MKWFGTAVASALLLLSSSACNKDGDLLSITRSFEGESIEQSVPAIPAIPGLIEYPLTVPLPAQTVETNARARLADYGMRESNLKAARLKAITITLDDPSGDFTLADVRDVVVDIETPGQPKITIATYPGASSPITTDQLVVSDTNLRDYVLDDPLTVTGRLVLLRPNTSAVTARIDFEYEVTGGI